MRTRRLVLATPFRPWLTDPDLVRAIEQQANQWRCTDGSEAVRRLLWQALEANGIDEDNLPEIKPEPKPKQSAKQPAKTKQSTSRDLFLKSTKLPEDAFA